MSGLVFCVSYLQCSPVLRLVFGGLCFVWCSGIVLFVGYSCLLVLCMSSRGRSGSVCTGSYQCMISAYNGNVQTLKSYSWFRSFVGDVCTFELYA